MAITPNTPNPVREDAYVEELSEKLGIDPQYIPKSPVWRNEEEIKAIAEMFANMSGGGGGTGGGVLVVNVIPEGEGEEKVTMDKTWQEIYDAPFSVARVQIGQTGAMLYQIYDIGQHDSDYSVSIIYPTPADLSVNFDSITFRAESANDYPTTASK